MPLPHSLGGSATSNTGGRQSCSSSWSYEGSHWCKWKAEHFFQKKRYFDQNSVHVPLFHSLEDLHLSQILKKYHLSTLDLMFSFLVQFQGRNGTFGDLGPRVDALHQASLKEMIFWQIFIWSFLQACTNQFQKAPGTFGDLGSRVDALHQASYYKK